MRNFANRAVRRCSASAFLTGLAFTILSNSTAHAAPIKQTRTLPRVDFVIAGVSGVGGGSGTIEVAGVTGPVILALLYWHGINNAGPTALYDNPTVLINGNEVTGVRLGDSTTNCWGAGSSRAFEANATAFVAGNGAYAITGLSTGAGHNANGAALVVIFDDGNPDNDRDLVFFSGNDSNIVDPVTFPDEDDGWHASLSSISYGGGPVSAVAVAADGQSFTDGSVRFSTASGTFTAADSTTLWDGNSLPTAGTSRAGNGALFDIHTFDITPAFAGTMGMVTLNVDGLGVSSPVPGSPASDDCLSLVLLLLDLEPGSAPLPECVQQTVNDRVSFVVVDTRLDPGAVPDGPRGRLFIRADLTNVTATSIFDPVNAIVTRLTGDNRLISATEGTGSEGSKQAVDVGASLEPGERVRTTFEIGLATRSAFTFLVNVEGCVQIAGL